MEMKRRSRQNCFAYMNSSSLAGKSKLMNAIQGKITFNMDFYKNYLGVNT